MVGSEILVSFQGPVSLYITLLKRLTVNFSDWPLHVQLSQCILLLQQLSGLMLQILSKAAPGVAIYIILILVGQRAGLAAAEPGVP